MIYCSSVLLVHTTTIKHRKCKAKDLIGSYLYAKWDDKLKQTPNTVLGDNHFLVTVNSQQ